MAAIRVKNEKEEVQQTSRVLEFSRADGWFVLSEYEIPTAQLKAGKLISKTEPDIFPILVEHLIKKARSLFGI